jgi:hypothetical protein
MSHVIDMATALELTLDDEQEAKFTAFRNLNLKKIKFLMSSIDAKDKKIAELKILGKDNRRTQMIQALKNKIRDQELVNDVIKEELQRKADMSLQETNDLIIRKTLGGPKRFRPLTREELENKITDLEKKATKKTNSNFLEETKNDSNNNTSHQSQPKTTTKTNNESKGSGSDGFPNMLHLLDEIDNLKMALAAQEGVVDAQREEVVRLRARNAELISSEEEIAYHAHQSAELKSYNEGLVESLEDTTRRLAESLENTLRARADHSLLNEGTKTELLTMQKQCEKLLKQNASLLQSMAAMEMELESVGHETHRTMQRSKSAEAGIQSMDETMRTLQERLARTEDKLSQSEARCASQEIKLQQIDVLRDQVRDKNIAVKEQRRLIEERDRAIANLKAANKALGGGGGGAAGASSPDRSASPPPKSNPVPTAVTYNSEAKMAGPGGTNGEVRRSAAK